MRLTRAASLMFSTLKICELNEARDKIIGVATGFAFGFPCENNQCVPFLVTNKHVLNNCTDINVVFTRKKEDGTPDVGNTVPVTISTDEKILHDTCDLAMLPLADTVRTLKANNVAPFLTVISEDIIPTDEEWEAFDAIEPIASYGYPDGLQDEVNNLPIIRNGNTATHPVFNFQGRPEFLADVACYFGSSGSPIFHLDGERYFLLGVEYNMLTVGAIFTLPEKIHGQAGIKMKLDVPSNLAQVVKSTELRALKAKLFPNSGNDMHLVR